MIAGSVVGASQVYFLADVRGGFCVMDSGLGIHTTFGVCRLHPSGRSVPSWRI